MTPEQSVQNFLYRSRRVVYLLAVFRGVLRAGPIFFAGLLIVGIWDAQIELSSGVRQTAWFVLTLLTLLFLASGFFPLSLFQLKERSRHFAARAGLRTDELLIAKTFLDETSFEGTSEDLRKKYFKDLALKLKSTSIAWCFPRWRAMKNLTLALSFLFIEGFVFAFYPGGALIGRRVWFPFFKSDVFNHLKILPGDTEVTWGADLEIHVSSDESTLSKPVVLVKSDASDWRELEPIKDAERERSFQLKNVIDPLTYRVRWKGEWSKRFSIVPVKPFQIKTFEVWVDPPTYLGAERIRQDSPEIRCLKGSVVTLKAYVTEPIVLGKIVFSDQTEKEFDVVETYSITCKFTVQGSGTYRLIFDTEHGGPTRMSADYAVFVVEDKPPTITLLSPDSDLVSDPLEKIPLTYETADDFGLSEVKLLVERSNGNPFQRTVGTFSKGQTRGLTTAEWDLSKDHFASGEIIRYRLQVEDRNTVTGPGRALTAIRVIEISSFDKAHETLEAALKEWREKAIDTLADMNTTKKMLEKDTAQPAETTEKIRDVRRQSGELEATLKKIVDKMENDPLTDYEQWYEHNAMRENLASLNSDTLPRADAAHQNNQKNEAVSAMEEAASELERMTALSEELSKNQKAKDVVDSSEKLEQMSEDLLKELQAKADQGSKLSQEDMNRINSLLQQAFNELQKMATSLEKMPDQLPEDFVNKEAVKNLDLSSSGDLLQQISEAMKNGDAKKALQLAQQFLKNAQEMSKKLSEAYGEYAKEDEDDSLQKEIAEQGKKLNEIIQKEADLFSETHQLEARKMERNLAEQVKQLKALGERQEKVVRQVQSYIQDKSLAEPWERLLQLYYSNMVTVAAELKAGQLNKSMEYLENITARFSQELIQSSGTLRGRAEFSKINEEEIDIFNELRTPPPYKDQPTPQEKEKFSKLKEEQAKVKQETGEVKGKIQSLSRQTANLGLSITRSISQSLKDMDEAETALGGEQSTAALREEEAALSHLAEAASHMENVQQMMGGQGEGSPTPGGGKPRPRIMVRGQRTGPRGAQTDRVRLPTADEYKAPKEFREELLKSLKERYPKNYEDLIHRYYKRLAE